MNLRLRILYRPEPLSELGPTFQAGPAVLIWIPCTRRAGEALRADRVDSRPAATWLVMNTNARASAPHSWSWFFFWVFPGVTVTYSIGPGTRFSGTFLNTQISAKVTPNHQDPQSSQRDLGLDGPDACFHLEQEAKGAGQLFWGWSSLCALLFIRWFPLGKSSTMFFQCYLRPPPGWFLSVCVLYQLKAIVQTCQAETENQT